MGGSAPESTGMGGAPPGMEGSTGRTERSSGLTSETTGRTGGTGMTGPAGTTGGTGTANRIVSEAQSELKSTLPTTDQPQTAAPLLQANVEGGTTTQADVIMQPIVHERGEAETLGYVPVTEPARSPEEAVEKLAGQIKETLNVRETGAPVLPKGPEIHGGKAAEVDVMMQPVVHKRGEAKHLGQVQQEALGTTGTALGGEAFRQTGSSEGVGTTGISKGVGTRRRSPSPPKMGTTEGLGTRRRSPSPPRSGSGLTGRHSPTRLGGEIQPSREAPGAPSTRPSSTAAIGAHPGHEHEHEEKEGMMDKTKSMLTKAKDKVKDVFKSNKDEEERPSDSEQPGMTTYTGPQGTTTTGHQGTTTTGHQGTTPTEGHKGFHLPGSEVKNLPTQL